jgi:hypothetical protein
MRKLTWLAAALAVLAVAGAALAHGRRDTGVKAVAAHFTATPTSKTTTRTCTGTDGHVWHLTRGVYTGTATGDLAGSITIRTQSTIDTTTGLGFTKGAVELRDPAGHERVASARISAVNTHNGVLDGMLEGRTRDGMLLANFTAQFTSDGSSLSGDIGSQSSGTNSAVVFGGPGCHNRMHPMKKPTPPPPRK